MSGKVMSLKAKINNYAKDNSIAAQVVLQNYMFERFLYRLSKSEYREKFVIKGGMLIAAIVGLDTRSTMDLDTTLKNIPLTKDQIHSSIKSIIEMKMDDDIVFEIVSIEDIRKDDFYGGFCVKINAKYDTIITPLSIDVSTGDIITPNAIKYSFAGIFDKKVQIELWGYNLETILAEKIETILSRGVFNTRPRDYYDIYILKTTQKYDSMLFKEALKATAKHRGSLYILENAIGIIKEIENSEILQSQWKKYQSKFSYAKDIQYTDIINEIYRILEE